MEKRFVRTLNLVVLQDKDYGGWFVGNDDDEF